MEALQLPPLLVHSCYFGKRKVNMEQIKAKRIKIIFSPIMVDDPFLSQDC